MQVWSSRLGRSLGRRQGRYLSEVMALFERGDLEEAMRRAIPMGSDFSEAHSPPLGLPGRRDNFRIGMGPGSGGSSMVLQDDFFAAMRRQYRLAFQRLEREGRIDEAAFVLLELLKDDDEGISFLEKHERFEMAAQIAEARDLPPARAVRQWLLAGDGERALHLARRHHAFASAVPMLEVSHPEEGARLRLWWADWAATSGDYVTAVEAAWTVAPQLAKTWIDRGIELGGVTAARLIVKKVQLDPASARTESLILVRELLADDTAEGGEARLALGQALLDAWGGRLDGIARGLLRALVRDLGHAPDPRRRELIQKLSTMYAPVERADMPDLPKRDALAVDRTMRSYTIEPSDRGAFDILDACLLPKGEVLIALGEAGCALLRRDGSWRHHFRLPAHQISIADGGGRAITITRRGRRYQLNRLNLETRREARWIEVQSDTDHDSMQPFAASYDGALFAYADGESVTLFDAQEETAVVLWRVGDLGMRVHAVARSNEWLSILGRSLSREDEPVSWERYSYALPTLRLHERQHLASAPEAQVIQGCHISPNGSAYVSYMSEDPLMKRGTSKWAGLHHVVILAGGTEGRRPDCRVIASALACGDQTLVAQDLAEPCLIKIWHETNMVASVLMEGATSIRARVQRTMDSERDQVILCDDLGRVLWFDSVTGAMLGSLRPRA